MPDLKKMLTLEALSEALPSWLKRSTKPEYNADEIDSTLTTNQFVTASDKENWNAKGTYSKPSGGIPKSDLSSIVQTSLEKADSALQSETDPTVPSWAKQTNKPSYTQDEVADGSTYKRVTQTEKDAWSGKQNALTTTQMQAVNSGITSEGVAQISTNQENIVLVKDATKELVDKGAKNQWDFANATVSGGGGADRVTYTKSSNSIAITAVNSWAFVAFDVQLKAGTYYFQGLVSSITGSDSKAVTIRINGYDGSVIKRIEITTNGIIDGDFVVDTDRTITVSFYASEGTFTNSSYTISDLMICTKAEYDISSNYVPFALSNPILTPALIECVDNGAKNKFNPEKATPDGLVTDGNGYAFKSILSDTRTILTFVLLAYNDNTIVRLLNDADITSTGLFSFTFVKGPDFNFLRFGHSGEVRDLKVIVDVSDLVNGETYVLSINVTATNPSVLIAWNSTMICTKAKWDVSHKFEPYALPNSDLTQLQAEDRAALAEVVDEGAKNVLRYTFEDSTSANGITVTRNADGTITANGTAGSGNSYVLLSQDLTLPAGTYIISAVNASDSNCYIYDNGSWESVSGNQERILDGSTSVPILLRVTEGTTLSNVVIKPMICRKEAWNISTAFVPYRSDYNSIAKFIEGVDIGGTNAVSNADLNSIDRTITRIYDNPSNAPYGLYGFMLVKTLYTDANTVFQEVTAVNNQTGTMFDSVRPKFIRTKTGGSWDPWIEMAENNRFLIDDGSYETATKTFNTTYLKYLRMYLITISRFYSPTSGSGVAMYAFNNSPSVPLLTTITEQSDCKATISVSNDVLTINYSEAGYYITSISLL